MFTLSFEESRRKDPGDEGRHVPGARTRSLSVNCYLLQLDSFEMGLNITVLGWFRPVSKVLIPSHNQDSESIADP